MILDKSVRITTKNWLSVSAIQRYNQLIGFENFYIDLYSYFYVVKDSQASPHPRWHPKQLIGDDADASGAEMSRMFLGV